MLIDETYIKMKPLLIGYFFNNTNCIHNSKDMYHDLYLKIKATKKTDNDFCAVQQIEYWIMKLAKSLYIDNVRKQIRQQSRFVSLNNRDLKQKRYEINLPDPTRNKEQDIIHKELVSEVWRNVLLLHASQINIIDMHVFNGLKYRIITEITGVKLPTALARMRYAREHLKSRVNF